MEPSPADVEKSEAQGLLSTKDDTSDSKPSPWGRLLMGFSGMVGFAVVLSYSADSINNSAGKSMTTLKEYKSKCLQPSAGPVLSGYDLVAYFSLEEGADAVVGSEDYSTTYGDHGNEYTFYFSSSENLALFEADPESYLPQNGGFCSW